MNLQRPGLRRQLLFGDVETGYLFPSIETAASPARPRLLLNLLILLLLFFIILSYSFPPTLHGPRLTVLLTPHTVHLTPANDRCSWIATG
jgi:hypothetical protein